MAHNLTLESAPQSIMRYVEALSSGAVYSKSLIQSQGSMRAWNLTVDKKGTRNLRNLETTIAPQTDALRPTPTYKVRLSPDRQGIEVLQVISPRQGAEHDAALGNLTSLRELTARASHSIYLSSRAIEVYEEIGMFPGPKYEELLQRHRNGGYGLISLDFKRSWVPALPVALALRVMPPYMLDRDNRVITRRLYLARLFEIDVISFDRLRSTYDMGQVKIRERDYARDEHALLSARDRGLVW